MKIVVRAGWVGTHCASLEANRLEEQTTPFASSACISVTTSRWWWGTLALPSQVSMV